MHMPEISAIGFTKIICRQLTQIKLALTDDADIFISIEKFPLLEVQVNFNTTERWRGNKITEISIPTAFQQKAKRRDPNPKNIEQTEEQIEQY